jgi:hypothetical protein
MQGLGKGKLSFFIQIFFRCKFFHIFGHKNPVASHMRVFSISSLIVFVIKDVQVTKEAFSSQKNNIQHLKHEIS